MKLLTATSLALAVLIAASPASAGTKPSSGIAGFFAAVANVGNTIVDDLNGLIR